LEGFVHCGFIFYVATHIAAGRFMSAFGDVRGKSVSMPSTNVKGFFKSEDCPSSNDLLEFERGLLTGDREGEVVRHLCRCEFCEAEVEFYSRFPQGHDDAEAVEVVRIPAPLFQLAEALLKKSGPSSLNSLLRESGLALDKA
jgi:hypothetical protein